MAEETSISNLSSRTLPNGLLIGTKLHVPSARRVLVPRPRLIERLNEALAARLILTSGPAGFGKTTLLSAWLSESGHSSAWVSLDANDNDTARFLKYVIAALQRVCPGCGETTRVMLQSPQLPPLEAMLTALVNDLCSHPGQLILVLDDYHVINEAAVHNIVTFLLDHLPAHVHLVISTRADPPLRLSRLRSRGQLAEIRVDGLRFSTDEALTFLGEVMGIDVSVDEAASLQARTEGWIAGLQMTALAMRGRQDISSFIRTFTGSHRYVLDFLLEEVLNVEPESVQAFLLQTSILERLTGPLCDALTGQTDGWGMLERLESENLFVVPLDEERRWYRYHHLFAEVLRNQLVRSQLAHVRTLHIRASDWYEREGLVDQAFQHALAAKEYARCSRLVQSHWRQMAHDGELNVVVRWLDELPEDIVRASPHLSSAYGWTLVLLGRVAEVVTRLQDAIRALAEQTTAEGAAADHTAQGEVAAEVAALGSFLARGRGDLQNAISLAEQALNLKSDIDVLVKGASYYSLASAYREVGEVEKALQAYDQAASFCWAGRNSIGANTATFYKAKIQQMYGHLRQAADTCRKALQFVEERGISNLPATGMIHVALADVLREWNQLDEAELHLTQGIELGKRGGFLEVLKNGGIVLARMKHARGDQRGALQVIEEAETLARKAGVLLAIAELAAHRARALVEQGDLAEAFRWAEDVASRPGQDCGYTRELEATTLARVLIAQGKVDEAIAHLDSSLAVADAQGREGSAVEILIIRALALHAQDKMEPAQRDLERALTLAQTERFVRVFLDEGARLDILLKSVIKRARCSPEIASYVNMLLEVPDAATGRDAPDIQMIPPGIQGPASSTSGALVEQLTERELDVLRLMARGLSNRKIAEELIIAVGTVKTHIHNICGKLGAQNRVQSIARARERHLLY
ncbi:MAG: helix-turn-helix transcriptional regulator [Chloroflexi bacterium]|nr:helix-turn-helix transcriptional regulator [Chloroflexota bacterium]